MTSSKALAGALLWTVASMAHADEPDFRFDGSFRTRYEALSGQSRPGVRSGDELASLRTILHGEVDFGLLRLGGQLSDSRVYLAHRDSAISTVEVDALEPTQFYVGLDVDQPYGEGTFLGAQAGRFTMIIGSRRLVSNDDYRNTPSTVGGLRVDAKLAGWSGTAWYVSPTQRLPEDIDHLRDNDVQFDRESRHAVLWGGIVTSPPVMGDGAIDVTFVKFRESDAPGRPTADRNLDTWSLRWYRDAAPSRWDYEFESIRQGGSARTSTALAAPLRDVDAGFWHARIGYQWAGTWKPRLALEYDRASGNSGTDKIRRFDTLLGGRRFDLAPTGLYNQLGRANLSSPGLRLELTPGPRSEVMATWKVLYLASRTDSFSNTGVRDASGSSGNHAGQQFDLRGRYWVLPRRLRAEVDAVLLAKARFLETAPNARPGDTRFYSMNLAWTL